MDSIAFTADVPIRYQADVAVLGAGMAGVCAAVAAARAGARVVLVERFAVAGGVLTTGGVANFCGDLAGQGEVFDDILAQLRLYRAMESEHKGGFHYELLAVVLQELIRASGIQLLLHARVAAVVRQQRRIQAVVLATKSGLEAVQARQFIDCTGEGDVARFAGLSVMKGRSEDGLPLPMSVMYFVRHVDPQQVVVQMPPGRYDQIQTADDLPMTSIWADGPGSNAIKVKVPKFDATDTLSLTAAEMAARVRMMQVMHYHQTVGGKPWRLDHCSPIIGIREGCRIVGDYVLTVDDLRAGRNFDDAVARGSFYLDGHKVDDDKRTYILPPEQRQVPPYQIPLGSLIARDADNLLMAGRCFSADQLALSSARVSTTCAMMGQAAGIAAAMSVQAGADVRQIDPARVRAAVEQRGANLQTG